jgi:hypothetical protein
LAARPRSGSWIFHGFLGIGWVVSMTEIFLGTEALVNIDREDLADWEVLAGGEGLARSPGEEDTFKLTPRKSKWLLAPFTT